jgi:hypothetical protein
MSSDIHFSFKWKNKHQAWFHSQAPVFIDFGDDKLYWLRKRPQAEEPFWYIQVVSKKEFITKYAGSDLPSVS